MRPPATSSATSSAISHATSRDLPRDPRVTSRVAASIARAFTQRALLDGAAPPPAAVPPGWTRRAEYPMLVAPRLHGAPHQPAAEVLAALLTGRPPQRWAHVYTGNVMPASPLFAPALPALPACPATPLARVLAGVDTWAGAPHASAWLLAHAPGSAAAAAAERAAVDAHRRQMLGDMISALRRRLRRLAAGDEHERLAAAAADGAAWALRTPHLATDATGAVPAAARAALRDPSLHRPPRPRKNEAAAARAPEPTTERKTSKRARRGAEDGAANDAAVQRA